MINLTKKDKKILKYIANGKSSTYIGEKMGYSPAYIDNCIKTLTKAFNAANRAQLVYLLAKEGSI